MEQPRHEYHIRRKPIQSATAIATPLLHTGQINDLSKRWPSKPKPVRTPLFSACWDIFVDGVLLTISISFIAFAQIVMKYDQAPTTLHPKATTALKNATKYGPTIFPLLFASVIGRLSHSLLMWRLESGERIEILDILATSTSLTNAFSSQFQLRRISFLGVFLIVVWAISPLGGQASLRQMSVEAAVTTTNSSIRYLTPNGMNLYAFHSSDNVNTFGELNPLFIGAMVAPYQTRLSSLDVWGNVKVPAIEPYETRIGVADDDWYDVNNNLNDKQGLDSYPSFVGIPVDGIKNQQQDTDYDFRLETNYLKTDCETYTKGDSALVPEPAPGGRNFSGQSGAVWWPGNDTRGSTDVNKILPLRLHYVSGYGQSLICDVFTSYVEVDISCSGNSTCRATRLRRSKLNHLPSAVTMLDIDPLNVQAFMKGFVLSLGPQSGSGSANLFDKYLADPKLPTAVKAVAPPPIDKEYSIRFGQLMSSYYLCMNGMFTLTGGINNDTAYFWDNNFTYVPNQFKDSGFGNGPRSFNWTYNLNRKSKTWPTRLNRHVHTEVIVAHRPWCVFLSIISIFLAVCSLIPVLMRHFIGRGPDIAMNFSSLATRDSSYMTTPTCGTYLDAADRFRYLKDLRIRHGDVDGHAEIGTLVIGSEGNDKKHFARITRRRLYN